MFMWGEYSSNLHIMMSSGGGPLEFHNIQGIVHCKKKKLGKLKILRQPASADI